MSWAHTPWLARGACLAGLLAALTAAHAADIADGARLAQAKNCLGCHRVDSKLVGPAYQSVATRHAGQPDAVDKLMLSIRKGSVRKWGAVPMPAQTQVTDAEARELAQWILSLKP
jgi:cytochrome c